MENQNHPIDFQELRQQEAQDYLSQISSDIPLGKQIELGFRHSVILPYPEIQFPLLAAYCASPITLATTAGILFLWGRSGLGKSQALAVAAGLYGDDPINSSSTYASLRNSIQEKRWYYPDLKEGEKNFLLCWDDIKPSLITQNDAMLGILKVVNRKSSNITISSPTPGQNMSFNAFSYRVLSSIHPIWCHPELIELKRRIFPIYFKHHDHMTREEITGNDRGLDDLLLAEHIDLTELSSRLESFWTTYETCKEYQKLKGLLKRRKARPFDNNRYQISMDPICSYCLLYEKSLDEAIELFSDYWKMADDAILSLKSGTEQWVESYLDKCKEEKEKFNKRAIDSGCPELVEDPSEVDPKKFKSALKRAKEEGLLDTSATITEIADLMKSKGYSLFTQSGNTKWRKLL